MLRPLLPVLLLLPLAGCLDGEAPPAAPADDVVVPPALVPKEVAIAFDGFFGFDDCIAAACINVQDQSAYTQELGNASLSSLNLTVSWQSAEPGVEILLRVECRVGAGRACPGARVVAEGQGAPPFTLSAAGLATPPQARLDIFVEPVRTLPPTFVNDQYSVQGTLVVLKDPNAPEDEPEEEDDE